MENPDISNKTVDNPPKKTSILDTRKLRSKSAKKNLTRF